MIFLFLCESGHNLFQQRGKVALLSSLREGLLCPFYIPVKHKAMRGGLHGLITNHFRVSYIQSTVSIYIFHLPIPDIKWIISIIHSQFRLKGPKWKKPQNLNQHVKTAGLYF